MSDQTMFQSPVEASLDGFNPDFDPDLDYLDGDDSFDFDNADLGGEMIGAVPGSGADADGTSEHHEKRKQPDGSTAEEGDAKRQETQDGEKGAKKPGRKPLTSEPTTKRKAQNRAAQRAFRERKEKHLKDLETKVNELTKTQEADKHENGLLKAQVERLQIELREYRKRLTLNGGSARSSPPLSGYGSQTRSNSGPSAGQGGFQFDFPKFGALPGSQIFGNQGNYNAGSGTTNSTRASVTPPTGSPGSGAFSQLPQQLARSNSDTRSMSPKSIQGGSNAGSPSQIANLNPSFSANRNANFAPYSTNENMHGFASTLPQMGSSSGDPFGDLFSPSILKTVGHAGNTNGNYFATQQQANKSPSSNANGGDSTAGIPDSRVFRFNSHSTASDTASPSASSMSQWNQQGTSNSSCGTSPEPSHDSPANKEKGLDSVPEKPVQQNSYVDQSQAFNLNPTADFSYNTANSTAFNVPQLDTFDPVLFGDYRDGQNNVLSGGDFSNGFFDDAIDPAPFDYGSPSNLFGILQNMPSTNQTSAVNAPTPSRNLMAEIDKTRDGGDDDYGLPTSRQKSSAAPKKDNSSGKLISCNNIWNQLQSNPDFQDGKFDLDGLCSELRSKARCSESGVMVDQDHVDAALRKLGKKDNAGVLADMPPLMFEQESWDKVLKKLGGGNRAT